MKYQRRAFGIMIPSFMMCMHLMMMGHMLIPMIVRGARCHECSSVAKNCTSTTSESTPVDVCDAQGRITQDDLFCGNDKCECGDGFSCVSLEVGCGELMLHKPSPRCISKHSLEQRFRQCSATLTNAPSSSNIDPSWIHFDNREKCTHADCLATRAFIACGEVECGMLVSVWRDDQTQAYHFVIDGTNRKGSSVGEIHFTAPATENIISCDQILDEVIPNCYVPQTLNIQGGDQCVGNYFERDTTKNDVEYSLSVLTWPVFIVVILSVLGAFVALAIAMYFIYHMKRDQEMEEDSDSVTKSMIEPDDTSDWKNKSDRLPHLRQRMKQEPLVSSQLPVSISAQDEVTNISEKQDESV